MSLENDKAKEVQQPAEGTLANLGGDLLSKRPENLASSDAGREKLAMNPEAAKINEGVGMKVANALESLGRHEPGKSSGLDLLSKDLVDQWKQTFAYLDPKVFDAMRT